MSRYLGPRLRIIRRLGPLPGLTTKKLTKRSLPGQHGALEKNKNKKKSPYSVRLQEKQKIRFNYGINEGQLLTYVRQAKKIKGSTGEVLLQLLEMRLDNIVFRLGMAPSIPAARQLVSHGHIFVNNKKINIASYQCQPEDKISVVERKVSQNLINNFLKKSTKFPIPHHLTFNKTTNVGFINSIINRKSINLKLNELLVIEYYSR
jgi:small subunit ribosomal protein S4